MKRTILACFLFLSTQGFSQNAGDAFFSSWTVHEIRFNFQQAGYWDSLKMNYTLDAYMSCDVSIDGVPFPDSGVKFKGNSSYNNQSNKKPFRIDFAEYVEDREFDGLKKLVLNNAFKDPTFLREKLMLDFMNAHGMAAPRATFTRLYINGHYWGLYSVVEDVNKTFLDDRFDNKGGNLFKGDPHGALNWKGAQQNLYEGDYELKTNETENDWSDLIRFIDVLNNTPALQLADSLDRYMNTSSWYAYWAAQNLFVNLDSYCGSGHNYFIYHNTDSDKFEWITWDVNEAFGNFQMGISLANIKILPYGYIPQPANQRPMMNRVWANTFMRQQYAERLCELLQDFTNEKLDSRIDSLAALIRSDVYADSLKFYGNTIFEQNLSQDVSIPNVPGSNGIAGLKSFISARHNSLEQQLASTGCVASDIPERPSYAGGHIAPNPAGDRISVEMPQENIVRFQLIDASGRVILSQAVENERVVSIGLGDIPQGAYFLMIFTEKTAYTEKLWILR